MQADSDQRQEHRSHELYRAPTVYLYEGLHSVKPFPLYAIFIAFPMKLSRQIQLLFLLLLCCGSTAFAQSLHDTATSIAWSRQNPLKVEDFKGKPHNRDTSRNNIHFLIRFCGDQKRKLLDNWARWYVRNEMYPYDSWIDQKSDTANQLKFLQTQFDLAEVHARIVRQALEIKGKYTQKTITEIGNKYLPDCKKEFDFFIKDTENGRNSEKLTSWQKEIDKRLLELARFRIAK